jgi:predicted nucleic acid-binding protein
VHVLSSKVLYNVPRAEIRTRLTAVIKLKGLKLRYKGMYLRALDLYATTNLDFVDALTVAQMERQQIATVVSFDRDFDKVATIARQEP